LENISYPFKKPNVLDIKLGTVLYEDTASEEKKQRMIQAAKATTSLETGVRITGFQVRMSKPQLLRQAAPMSPVNPFHLISFRPP